MPMTLGDVTVLLTLIEAHARAAREQLASSIIVSGTPDGILKPGQPMPTMTNRQMGAALMQHHQASMQKLNMVIAALFNQPAQGQGQDSGDDGSIPPTAGRIGQILNGDGNG